jgi:hypothetical protein
MVAAEIKAFFPVFPSDPPEQSKAEDKGFPREDSK